MKKIDIYDNYDLLKQTILSINKAFIHFNLKNPTLKKIYVHGSQITEKEYPNDIDIYVQIDFDNEFPYSLNNKEIKTKEELIEIIHNWLWYNTEREFEGIGFDLSIGKEIFERSEYGRYINHFNDNENRAEELYFNNEEFEKDIEELKNEMQQEKRPLQKKLDKREKKCQKKTI